VQDIDSSIAFGRFRMDLSRRTLLADGQPVALHARAFDILEYLVASRDRAVTRDEIIGHVWRGLVVGENNLSVQMSTLRRVLAQHGGGDLIVTVPHRGYQFIETAPAAASIAAAMLPTAQEPPLGETAATSGQDRTRRSLAWRWPAAGFALLVFLLMAILAGRREAPVPGPQAGTAAPPFDPPPHSVAVLAFDNISGDQQQDYFSDGLSEELIDSLGRLDGIRVTGHSSSFSFKGRRATTANIARQLNVATVLEGSVRRDGGRLRITARLVDARSGYILWEDRFDRDQGQILKIQEEIAEAVTTSLRDKLLDRDTAALQLGGTSNPKAFDAYLRGRKFQAANDEDSNHDKEAIAAFDEALAIDPQYALAEAMRAYALVDRSLWDPSGEDVGKLTDAAVASATRATALAPDLGVAHGALALALGMANHYAAAQAEYDLALRLSPNNPSVKLSFASFQLRLGNLQRSVELAQEAVALDPLTAKTYSDLAWFLFEARRYDEALTVIDHAQQLAPGNLAFASGETGFIHIMKGDPEHALKDCNQARDVMQLSCLAVAYYKLGRGEDAQNALAKLRSAKGDADAYTYAQLFAQWSQPGEACKWLDAALRLHDPLLQIVRVDPMMDPIRDAPEYTNFLHRMSYPQ
jgi:TolB-like protein/DNA-binding winged helix-turn-helix (wHTH) protein/Flp pilus assembly protein TadD